jgi:oxygen-independent coproporphyrinogen-3 oxidase
MTFEGARMASEAHRRPSDYVKAVTQRGIGWASESRLSGEESADEILLMGLRIEEGVELARVEALRGRALNRAKLTWLVSEGLVVQDAARTRLTPRGRVLTNRIIAELVS